MSKVQLLLLLTMMGFFLAACGDWLRDSDSTTTGEPVVQHAAMILHYPHDDHKFGELPSDLEPVQGATAELERHDDHVNATIETRIIPGHVGKLLAVVINNPEACTLPTPGTACGPHEEEFNREADGGFYLGEGAVAGPDGQIELDVRADVGDTSNLLCGGAANPDFDSCTSGFSLRDPYGAEITLVVLDNGLASRDSTVLAQQLSSSKPCPTCLSYTAQIAIGFGLEAQESPAG